MKKFFIKASYNGLVSDYIVVSPNTMDAAFIFSSTLPSHKIIHKEEIPEGGL